MPEKVFYFEIFLDSSEYADIDISGGGFVIKALVIAVFLGASVQIYARECPTSLSAVQKERMMNEIRRNIRFGFSELVRRSGSSVFAECEGFSRYGSSAVSYDITAIAPAEDDSFQEDSQASSLCDCLRDAGSDRCIEYVREHYPVAESRALQAHPDEEVAYQSSIRASADGYQFVKSCPTSD